MIILPIYLIEIRAETTAKTTIGIIISSSLIKSKVIKQRYFIRNKIQVNPYVVLQTALDRVRRFM